METAKRIIYLLILALLTAVPLQSAEKASGEISGTYKAACLVKITSEPAVLPLNVETIDYLLRSSGVGGKAAREVLNLSPDQIDGIFTIQYEELLDWATNTAPESSNTGRPAFDATKYNSSEIEYYETTKESKDQRSVEGGSPTLSRFRTSTSSGPSVRPSSSRTQRQRSTTRSVVNPSISVPTVEQTYLFSLNVELPPDAKPAAEEFMYVLINYLRDAIARTFDEHSNRLARQLNTADEEVAREEEELRQKQAAIRSVCGSNIFDRDVIAADIGSLRTKIQQAKMNQMSDQVMVETTTRQIAEIQDKLKEQIDKDMIRRELTELLVLQERSLQNVEKLSESGHASGADIADAREKLARARIELAQRSEQLSKSKGGDLVESLNNTLADRSVKIAEYQAYLSSFEQQLAEAEGLLDKIDDYELLSLKTEISKQNLQEAIMWRDRISRQVRMLQPPTVSVIGG